MVRGITDQDVFDAADRLLARGEHPTNENVRQPRQIVFYKRMINKILFLY